MRRADRGTAARARRGRRARQRPRLDGAAPGRATAGLPALARLLLDAGAPVAVGARQRRHAARRRAVLGPRRDGRAAGRRGAGAGQPARGGGARRSRPARRCSRRAVAARAGAARGFYRPHGGFPAWTPGDEPAEIVDEALTWAARSDRADALGVLVERGATGRRRRLPRNGARVGGGDGPRGGDRGAGRARRRRRRAGDVRRAAARRGHHRAPPRRAERGDGGGPGAAGRRRGPRTADALYDGTPADWAAHAGADEAAALLRG